MRNLNGHPQLYRAHGRAGKSSYYDFVSRCLSLTSACSDSVYRLRSYHQLSNPHSGVELTAGAEDPSMPVGHTQAYMVHGNNVTPFGTNSMFVSAPEVPEMPGYDLDAFTLEAAHPAGTPLPIELEDPGNSGMRACQCRWAGVCHSSILLDRGDCHRHIVGSHLRGVTSKNVVCLWQGCYAILKRESITKHVLNAHLGRQFGCAICGNWYKGEKSSVKRHAEIAHPEESLEIVERWDTRL